MGWGNEDRHLIEVKRHRTAEQTLRGECDKLRAALTTVLDILGDPADDEACALRCLGPQVIAAARGALL